MMRNIARVPSNVSSSTSVSLEKRSYGRKRRDREDPMSASTERKLSTTIIMSNLSKVSPEQATQSGMMTMLGLLKSVKLILRCTSDQRDPMLLLGE